MLEVTATHGRLPDEAAVLFENRKVSIKDGKLHEELEPNGVRAYELRMP